MQEFARRRVSGYSHGMKQRLCIAQALINKPEFIVFDEPTNGLDPRGAYETRQLIKNLSREGTTIFLNSHILPEVEDVCTRVAILSRGKILVQAPVTDLRRQLKGDRTRVTVSVDNPSQALERAVITRDAALSAHLQGPGLVCELGPQHSIPELVSVLTKAGARIRGVQEEVLGLEDIFLQLTQGEGGV
jgi:ABC-2 type transport system ATP-binding protein